ncbi:hypothetical protein VUR80DRAFT_7725 [Thermomyces stellatus]
MGYLRVRLEPCNVPRRFACDSWLLLVLVIGDLLVALPLLASAVKQAMFAPTTYSACGDAINWRNGTDGRNFFLAAEWVAWETYGPAESFCKNMTENWAITIAMVVLYGLMGIINVVLFIILERDERRYRRTYALNYNSGHKDNIFVRSGRFIWRVVVCAATPILWVLEYPLAAFRVGCRYVHKTLGGWKAKRNQKAAPERNREARGSVSSVERRKTDVGKPPVLPFEILLLIARDLHFADLVSASRASKALRTGLFGTGDVAAVLRAVRDNTCPGGRNDNCRLCGLRTCGYCQELLPVAASLASRHMTICRPYCSKCYFKRARETHWGAKHRAACALSQDIEVGATPNGGLETKLLCRLCVALTPEERRERFEVRDRAEVRKRVREPTTCGKCSVALPKGTMWWVCHGCFAECPSNLHRT